MEKTKIVFMSMISIDSTLMWLFGLTSDAADLFVGAWNDPRFSFLFPFSVFLSHSLRHSVSSLPVSSASCVGAKLNALRLYALNKALWCKEFPFMIFFIDDVPLRFSSKLITSITGWGNKYLPPALKGLVHAVCCWTWQWTSLFWRRNLSPCVWFEAWVRLFCIVWLRPTRLTGASLWPADLGP